ncbi:GAF domain-containing protein [Herbaspirillum sp. RU 5E]|nr:GAF domain-containing protein [Herbaspirillum sp. RU 5E]
MPDAARSAPFVTSPETCRISSCAAQLLDSDEGIDTLWLKDPVGGDSWIARRAALSHVQAHARLQREMRFGRRIASACPDQAPRAVWEGDALILLFPASETNPCLQAGLAPLPLADFLVIAIACARKLGQWHAAGLLHGDLRTEHIYHAAAGEMLLVGASAGGEDGSLIASSRALPYQPAQQGQAGVYHDLYALGQVFFRLLAAAAPWPEQQVSDWQYVHSAIEPRPLSSLRSDVPAPLEQLVARLLGKTAAACYSSATALLTDLLRCQREYLDSGFISPFELDAAATLAAHFRSERLHGREPELDKLQQALDRVCETGGTEVVMIGGRGGIGKSALARWLLKRAHECGAAVGAGKCDQLGSAIPYAVIAQAVHMLVVDALGQQQSAVDDLAARWQGLVSGNAGLVTGLVPQARHLLGSSSPALGILTPQGRIRTERALVRSVEAFARSGQPVVVLLDDLHWADEATLSFLDEFFADPPANVLLVGAYRDHEGSFSQRCQQALHARRHSRLRLLELTVEPLSSSAFGDIVNDALTQSGEQLGSLVQVLHEKSGGNPYFARQLLQSWIDDGALELVGGGEGWRWLEEKGLLAGHAEHVVDLMIQRISRLPGPARLVLQQFGCIGIRSETVLLERACGLEAAVFLAAIDQLCSSGMIARHGAACVFQHDRVLEAAYALTPPEEKSAAHARVARSMLACWDDDGQAHAYEIGNQIEKIALDDLLAIERPAFAHILLLAARLAQRASAVERAADYVRAAQAMMDQTWWQDHHALAYEAALIECELLVAKVSLAQAAERIQAMLPRAVSPIARASAYRLEAVLHTLRSDYGQAIEASLTGLRILGIVLQRDPDRHQVRQAFEDAMQALGGRPIASLADLPLCQDEEVCAAMSLLSTLMSSVFFADDLSFTHLAKLVELSLRHGVTVDSPYGLAWFGVFSAHHYGLFEDGHAFGLAALALVDQHGYESGRIATLVALDQIAAWTQPLEVALEYAQQARQRGISCGDIGMACYACNHIVSDMLAMGEALPLVDEAAEQGLALTRSIGYLDIELLILSQQEFAVQLMKGPPPAEPQDAQAWLARCEDRAARAGSLATRFWIWLYAGMLAGYRQQWALAHTLLERSLTFIRAIPAHINIADCHLFHALAVARSHASGAQAQQAVMTLLRTQCERFAVWAGTNRHTFHNKLLLLQGELARLEGQPLQALMHFEQSARTAHAAGFPHEQALAHELAAELCRRQSLDVAAVQHERLARAAYQRWGAASKAAAIRAQEVVADEAWLQGDTGAQAQAQPGTAWQLELRAAQALSRESVREKLVETMMGEFLQHAAAQYGVLVRMTQAGPMIEASSRLVEQRIQTSVALVEPTQGVIPLPLLNRVIRTRQAVSLHDAQSDAVSMRLQREDAAALRSVLCLPLLRGGELLGVLYLENNLAPGVFHAARLTRLELMAPQMAVALESARLYEQLIAESDARGAAERSLHAARTELVENAHLTVLANLAASIAHEINQPLGAIVTSAEATLRWLNRATPDIERAQDGLQRVRKEGLRAAGIIRALRGLARQAPAELDTIDMTELVSEVAGLLAEDISAREIDITLALEPRLAVEGDKVQLQQVILNLLKNASEAMSEQPPGHPRKLEISTHGTGQQVQLQIADSGPGLGGEQAERIFEPFYTTKESGLGMGLAICRSISEAHGGSLAAENRPGGGALFVMALPLARSRPPV